MSSNANRQLSGEQVMINSGEEKSDQSPTDLRPPPLQSQLLEDHPLLVCGLRKEYLNGTGVQQQKKLMVLYED